jgi:hypothetical protein
METDEFDEDDSWDDIGSFELPDFIPVTDIYRVGSAIAPAWVLSRMEKQQLVVRANGEVDVLVRGHFIRAYRDHIIVQVGINLSILTTETCH